MRRLSLATTAAVAAALACAGPAAAHGDLVSEWYSDTGLQNLAYVDGDETIDFAWPEGTDPPGLSDTWSARWTGQIQPRYSEQYVFPITRDDVARLWVGGQLIFDEDWSVGHTGTATSDPIALEAGHKYDLKLEFADGFGDAEIRLGWQSPSQAQEIVPADRLYPPAPPPPSPPGQEKKLFPKTPGTAMPAAPQPDAGRSVAGKTKSGRILVRKPGSRRVVALDGSASVPVGSVIDARRGHVQLLAEGARDKQQTVEAWGAIFSLAQKRRGDRVVTLSLKRPRCRRAKKVSSSKRRKGNRLWAHAKGRFRTRGRWSATTVRGTTWLTRDTCSTTTTAVREGLVAVRDFARRRTVMVPAGKRYVAKRRLSARR